MYIFLCLLVRQSDLVNVNFLDKMKKIYIIFFFLECY